MPANKKTKVQCKIIAMRIAFVYAGSCLALLSTFMRLVEPMPRTIAVAMAGKRKMFDFDPSASASPMMLKWVGICSGKFG